jgi:hypothetical protein
MSKGTRINIGGADRTLRFDLNAWEEIEDRLDVTLRPAAIQEDLLELANRPLKIAKTSKIFLLAGLLHESPKLTLKQVGSWVDFKNVKEVMDAFLAQLPEMSAEAEGAVKTTLGVETEKEQPVGVS